MCTKETVKTLHILGNHFILTPVYQLYHQIFHLFWLFMQCQTETPLKIVHML